MKFHSEPLREDAEAPIRDEGRFEALVARFSEQATPARATLEGGNACYVVSVRRPNEPAGARLDEITGLVEAKGDRVVGQLAYVLDRADPRTLIRRGVAERVAGDARVSGADLLVFDAELTPSQTRNLEDATGFAICDREAVILEVFERHATTRRARVQVEIAHLEYLRPRIRGIGLNMDQQAGGIMGSRGPGETASELLARRLDGRLSDLRRSLVRLERADAAQRKKRGGCARVVFVGYTNAGKTSLMNALTGAGLSARDRPFETLDTTSRCLTRHGGDVLLSDTVGFIRRLPKRLFASFASTLTEAVEASLLLQVLDVSDPELEEHIATTDRVLDELGATDVPRLLVFNKTDRLGAAVDRDALVRLSGGHPFLTVSSLDPEAVARLREAVLSRARVHHSARQVFVPYDRADVAQLIYTHCRVRRAIATDRGTQFQLEGAPHVVAEIEQLVRRQR